jgi:hypothetical protein
MKEKGYIETYTIKSIKDMLNIFSITGKYSNVCPDKYVFRGIKNIKYPLIPSSLRLENIEYIANLCSIENFKKWKIDRNLETWQISVEYDIFRQFFEIADKSGLSIPETPRLRRRIDDGNFFGYGLGIENWMPYDLFAIAGLAQHYGLPTRLLDWTYDYKVGLYFAVSGLYSEKNRNADAVLFAINYFYFKLIDAIYDGGPLQFFRPDYFGNPNLAAQKGLFSVWQILQNPLKKEDPKRLYPIPKDMLVDRRSLDEILMDYITRSKEGTQIFKNNKMLYKFIIPGKLKKDIMKQLALDGYTEENLFPGLNGVSLAIKNRGILHDFS